ncbi:DUF3304 domain-containing protein [Massilia sp. CMS3.1]|uniref:DUF3304 domain-containing protein n=1 Tax=Massilia sp. CMS3.1 TaxID=3373083 RepID=UPI003EE447E2
MKPHIALLSAFALLLTGCSKATEPTGPVKTNTVSVNVHGVNYTAEPFRYVLVDPANPSNGAAEHISPFSGGGIMCCFTLPKRWSPGIRVNVQSTHWLPETDKGDLPEVEKIYTVEVPAYPEGAGELWVLRTADGAIELVTSNVEPDHPQWPGKVKGWPEPSLTYQRERWKLYRKIAEDKVDVYRASLDHLKKYTQAHLQNEWDVDKERQRNAIKKFSGPNDPAYAEYKTKSYIEGLQRSEKKLKQLLKEKP